MTLNLRQVAEIIEADCQIVLVGDVMLDVYINGHVSRVSPEAPVPVLKVHGKEHKVGGAGNVALNLVELGADVKFYSAIGNDENGDTLQKLLENKDVDCELVRGNDVSTITKTRLLSGAHQIARVDEELDLSELAANQVYQKLQESDFSQGTFVILSDYNKGIFKNSKKYLDLCASRGWISIVDPKKNNPLDYQGANFVTPNMGEFLSMISLKELDEHEFESKAKHLLKKSQFEHLVVTRSEKGVSLVTEFGCSNFPALAKDVSDVTGAGDTFIASMAKSLAAGSTIEKSLDFSNLCASITVQNVGAYAPNKKDIYSYISEQKSLVGRKILDCPQELNDVINALRCCDKKIVFTNGCFDVLHAGHIRLLRQARASGDCLVVGLNRDDSIKRLKGESRPINSEDLRVEVLSSLSCVDYLVLFGSADDDTPLNLINNIKPDFLVKGGDYELDSIVGAKEMSEWGGNVLVVPLVGDLSTTKIVNSGNSSASK